MSRPDREMTLCFLVRESGLSREVVLAAKKGGKWDYLNGYGGKVEGGQSVEDAVLDELSKESSVVAAATDLKYRGYIDFHVAEELFGEGKGRNHRCHIYVLEKWQGQPCETKEMGQPEWYCVRSLPFDRMWSDDRYWVEQVLVYDQRVYGEVYLGIKREVTKMSVRFVDVI